MIIHENMCLELGLEPCYDLVEHIEDFIASAPPLTEGVGATLRAVWESILAAIRRFWDWVTGKRRDQEKAAEEAAVRKAEAMKAVEERMERAKERAQRAAAAHRADLEAKLRTMQDSFNELQKDARRPVRAEVDGYENLAGIHEKLCELVHSVKLGPDGDPSELLDRLHQFRTRDAEGPASRTRVIVGDAAAAAKESDKLILAVKNEWEGASRVLNAYIKFGDGPGGEKGPHSAKLHTVLVQAADMHNALLRRIVYANARLRGAAAAAAGATAAKAAQITEHMDAEDRDRIFSDKNATLVL